MQIDEQYSESLEAFRALAHVRQRLWAAMDRELQATEHVSMTWFEVLGCLENSDGAMPMNELASALLSSPSGMTRLVDRIEQAGFVRRTPHGSDRRITLVALTDSGRAIFDRVIPKIKLVLVEQFASKMSEKQARELRSILEQLLQETGGIDGEDAVCAPEPAPAKRKTARTNGAAVRS